MVPRLKKLNLYNCPQVQESTIQFLQSQGIEVLQSSEPFNFENIYPDREKLMGIDDTDFDYSEDQSMSGFI